MQLVCLKARNVIFRHEFSRLHTEQLGRVEYKLCSVECLCKAHINSVKITRWEPPQIHHKGFGRKEALRENKPARLSAKTEHRSLHGKCVSRRSTFLTPTPPDIKTSSSSSPPHSAPITRSHHATHPLPTLPLRPRSSNPPQEPPKTLQALLPLHLRVRNPRNNHRTHPLPARRARRDRRKRRQRLHGARLGPQDAQRAA